jgi:glutamyl-tRNA synthetase
MSVRVRFAPSPTGHVHIGNIRVAIFNWLFARNEGGAFLVRVEDTDRERATPEAVNTLLEALEWLGLSDFDEEPLYQTSQRDRHLAAADELVQSGAAYRHKKGEGAGEATIFRFPLDADHPLIHAVERVTIELHPDAPLTIASTGIVYSVKTKKGKAHEQGGCLAGFADLEVVVNGESQRFTLSDFAAIAAGDQDAVQIEGGTQMSFHRREVRFTDLVKGELSKPLDSMKDLVIVRSDGNPVFHLANVCDDATQHITHILRGDDHVENTFRHLFLFEALGLAPPAYGHFPMIVDRDGRPISKRTGDTYVGQYRDKGYLPSTLVNFLALLGWSPGDDREKMSREELVEAFSLDRVKSSPAQLNLGKLRDMNGQYIAALPTDLFFSLAQAELCDADWASTASVDDLRIVAELMQSRTKLIPDVHSWEYFFVDDAALEYDAKQVRKVLAKPGIADALVDARRRFTSVDFTEAALEAEIAELAPANDFEPGKLNQPLRVAVTGCGFGAGIYETLAILGRERVNARLARAIELAQVTADTGA